MNRKITAFPVTLSLLTTLYLTNATAQITETKLLSSDGAPYDWFGRSVSLSGDNALIGAEYDDDNGGLSGSAYIFEYNGSNWVEQTKLIASDGEFGDLFGVSVSLSGDYALIGAFGVDGYTGSAYVFYYDGSNWVEQAKLIASEGEYNLFGVSVSLSGDYALIGAPWDGTRAGSAYIFHYDGTNWVEHTKLIASDRTPFDQFGRSVSLFGEYAIVGASPDEAYGTRAGSAYIFQYDGSNWVEQTKLEASDGAFDDQFGESVSIIGTHALVGAPEDDGNLANEAGSAYIFHHDGSSWIEQAKLIASDALEEGHFGVSVSLSGNYALLGADGGNGSAYIFHYDGSSWEEQAKLIGSSGSAGSLFGQSVSLSGDYALVGARYDDDNGTNAGSAHVYAATPLCSKVSQFQARCRTGGLIKARVTMADASHAGDVIEISIDGVPYQVTIDATGRGQLSQGGFNSGQHTVELTNPGQCFDPIVVTCRTGLDEEAGGDWDDEQISESPTETALLGNYPNPFNPSTTIRYALSSDGSVSIRVYNMLGQEVATLIDGFQKAGEQSVTWHGTNNLGQSVATGLYIYRLQAGSTVMSQKMLFAK